MTLTDAALFEHVYVLIKQSSRLEFRSLSSRTQQTMQNMESTVYRVQETEDGVERSASGVLVPENGSVWKEEENIWCGM